MLDNISDLERLAKLYLVEFNAFCDQNQLVGKVQADHICVRCSSKEKYETQKALFDFESKFIYQSIISNRRISVIGLSQGLETTVGQLNYLELSDQKQDGSQVDQIDHVEIVPTTISYEELVEGLLNRGVSFLETVRPHHTTHDIKLSSGFTIKLSREMLIDKIKREEMV